MDSLGALLRRLWGQAYLLLALTMLMWGGNAVAARLAVGELSPMVLTTLRWTIAVVPLIAFGSRSMAAEWRFLLGQWPRILLMAGSGFTLFNALFYLAAETTSAINIGMIQGVMPALVLLGSLLVYRNPIRAMQALGLLIAAMGVTVVVSRGDAAVLLHARFVIGDLLILIACLFYAAYGISLRSRPPGSALAFFAALSIGAAITSLPFLGYEIWSGRVLWPGPKGWAIIVFVALGPSLIGQVFFMRGVELIGPGRAGLSVLILGESFAPYHAVALVLVLSGIWMAERRPTPA